ncbi:MAG: ferrous iron transport protein B [Saprospiraceae bacterium]|nr:ferrous iron transport protein B [Saprospiraceae bacterium]
MSSTFKIALLGNPNCGKSTIFNLLTGLNQKVGNFPGVTVDKKTGSFKASDNSTIQIIDLPGTYSLYPNSEDEKVVTEILSNPGGPDYPDLLLYIADASNIEKHLLLFTQAVDLNLDVVLLLNMIDVADHKNIKIDKARLEDEFKVPVFPINGRNSGGIDEIKNYVNQFKAGNHKRLKATTYFNYAAHGSNIIEEVSSEMKIENAYLSKLWLHHYSWLQHLSPEQKDKLDNIALSAKFENVKSQIEDTLSRFDRIIPIVKRCVSQPATEGVTRSEKYDKVLSHYLWGPIIFFSIMFLVFQAIYTWAELPMTWIEDGFIALSSVIQEQLPSGWATDLLTEGILAGLGGIVVFVPQIAILFLLISLLEESGYMARAVYMFDGLMQKFGLNGRSIVALISGGACAIPAIMSTRTIGNWKERMITIMVTPLISCSARIPIYTVLIGLLVSSDSKWGPFNLQGVIFMGLYLTGIISALGLAWIMKLFLKSRDASALMLELPEYKTPVARNVFFTVKEKVYTFVSEAGKVILIISVALWFLASYGPADKMAAASAQARNKAAQNNLNEHELNSLEASLKLESSYAGIFGKSIEPAIEPLGFDWKIGISLLTSFAAREVFVGTMSTIYSVGSEDESSVRQKLAEATDPQTGVRVYTFATTLSLLIFYIFAMQCMSTFAIVKRETKSLKWPVFQFVLFAVMAYTGSWITYSVLT